MATIANWNGHTFEVSPHLIRGFTDFTIKGSCETTTKNSNKQKYEKRKYGESPQFSMTIGLNALTGVTDVFGEALEFVSEATAGACAYFYMGTKKLIPAQAILTSAEVVEVVNVPGEGCKWISCNVKVTFKQGSKNDSGKNSSSSSSSKKSSKKASVKTSGTKSTTTKTTKNLFDTVKDVVTTGINAVKNLVSNAKSASTKKKTGLQENFKTAMTAKKAQTQTSSTKKAATTSRNCEITTKKITRVPTTPKFTAILKGGAGAWHCTSSTIGRSR